MELSACGGLPDYVAIHSRLMGQTPHLMKRPAMTVNDLPPPLTWQKIAHFVCSKHRIGIRDLLGGARHPNIVVARDEAIGLIFEHTDISLSGIGRLFRRNHSTVIWSLAKRGLIEGTPTMQRRMAERAAI